MDTLSKPEHQTSGCAVCAPGVFIDPTSFATVGSTDVRASQPLAVSPEDGLLPQEQFNFFRSIAKRHAGISISEHKNSMLSRRVRTRLKALSVDSVDAYRAILRSPDGKKELQHLVNALTTNKTSFFRESDHFRHLAGHVAGQLAALPRGTKRTLRIWSAGCSTGEEPYSISMTLDDVLGSQTDFSYAILGTDIDTNVLSHAEAAVYARSSLVGFPALHAARHLIRCPNDSLRIAPRIRQRVSFRQFNLNAEWPIKGPFDIIFCRNVIIYFDKATQRDLVERFAAVLRPDGLLYCGHSESLHGLNSQFQLIGRCIYRRAR